MKIIKKISLSLICVVLLVATLFPVSALARQPSSAPSAALPWRGTVTASSLNVRSGPGTTYSSVSSLPNNRMLHIVQRSGAWYRVYFSGTSTQTGWVSSDFVNRPNPTSMWVFRVTGSGVNYRTGPGLNYASVATLSLNTILPRAGTASAIFGFNHVIFRGLGGGWMASSFLESAPQP